jgi:hypothetical protein
MRAIKLYSRVEKNRTLSVRLPDDVAEGPAEVIVLVPENRQPSSRPLVDELDAIALHCASLPVLDARTADEILGYDERGLPR